LISSSFGQLPVLVRTYQNTQTLTSSTYNGTNAYFELHWTISATTNLISIGMICLTPGWCAIGFSETGSMVRSDAAIGSVAIDGTTTVLDFSLNAEVAPANGTACPSAVCPDSDVGCVNNVGNVLGSRNGNYIALEFTRPLISCDSCDRAIEYSNNNESIIWAFGDGEVPLGIQRESLHFVSNFFNWNSTTITGAPPNVTALFVPQNGSSSASSSSTTSGTTAVSGTGISGSSTTQSGGGECAVTSCVSSSVCRNALCVLIGVNALCTYPQKIDGTVCQVKETACYYGTCQSGLCDFEYYCNSTTSGASNHRMSNTFLISSFIAITITNIFTFVWF